MIFPLGHAINNSFQGFNDQAFKYAIGNYNYHIISCWVCEIKISEGNSIHIPVIAFNLYCYAFMWPGEI